MSAIKEIVEDKNMRIHGHPNSKTFPFESTRAGEKLADALGRSYYTTSVRGGGQRVITHGDAEKLFIKDTTFKDDIYNQLLISSYTDQHLKNEEEFIEKEFINQEKIRSISRSGSKEVEETQIMGPDPKEAREKKPEKK